ncbi:MAG TPA: YihY/virulence factor BrkB family protein [Anaerolineales bacterium]|nr:YihY/virulence factor BrkB family protein [Anaerolineales bacterium]
MKKVISNLPTLLKLTYQGWKEDKASRLAAALAYYTIFSLGPLLIIVIAVTGLFWDEASVQSSVTSQVQGLVGEQGEEFVSSLLTSASNPARGIAATIVGIITLIFGALGAFNELHNALNTIWEVKEEEPKGFVESIKNVIFSRLLSFSMILGIGFLLLVSLVISAGLSAAQETLGNAIPVSEIVMQIINLIISTAVITALFALIFKFLPDAEIAWRDVWLGAFFTALLFSLGKFLIGLYLGNSAVGSSFGAAGSLVLLLIWIYYSAQILFFGAEFTQVYANEFGSKIVPEGDEAQIREQPQEGLQPRQGAQPARKPEKAPTPRLAPPAASAISARENQLEQYNRQTARVFVGLMAASFFTGIVATVFGLKRR